MLGTNLSGDEKPCLINKHCDSSYGELHFTDNNGVNHVLIRGKNRYTNDNNFITLDGKSVTQAELTKFYKDKKLFLSIINPLYFLNKRPAEQKEMVDKYLNDICPNNIMEIAYNNLSAEEQALLEGVPCDIPTYISELNENIKQAESTISTLDGKIGYAQNIVNTDLSIKKVFEKGEELTLAKQELSFLSTNQDIIDKEKQKQTVESIEKDILNKETEFKELETEMINGKKKYLAIKNGTSCICPTCNQHIENENKNITITNMHNDLMAKYDKKNILETQIKDLKVKLSIEKCKFHALEGDTTIEKAKRIAVVEENIKQLENEKLELEKFNQEIETKEKMISNAKADISSFNKEKQLQIKYIDNSKETKKVAQKLYISYIEEKMKLAKEYLKDVDIKFYSVLKTTGEIKEDFIITYKNTPLADLSRSETIATALEFANMFNKITKSDFPIFIDDYESCADYDFIKYYSKDTQLIISKVEKRNALKIADYNSNKYTIIKPIIIGFKTMNLCKKNATNIKKVA